MKFLFINKNLNYNEYSTKLIDLDFFEYLDYLVSKDNFKRRKILNRIKKGVTKNEKKNSLKRDLNQNLFQQYINVVFKKGQKEFTFSQFNIISEVFFFSLSENFDEFKNYDNYSSFIYLSNLNKDFNNFNFVLTNSLEKLESIFDIKTKKNSKKLK